MSVQFIQSRKVALELTRNYTTEEYKQTSKLLLLFSKEPSFSLPHYASSPPSSSSCSSTSYSLSPPFTHSDSSEVCCLCVSEYHLQ